MINEYFITDHVQKLHKDEVMMQLVKGTRKMCVESNNTYWTQRLDNCKTLQSAYDLSLKIRR